MASIHGPARSSMNPRTRTTCPDNDFGATPPDIKARLVPFRNRNREIFGPAAAEIYVDQVPSSRGPTGLCLPQPRSGRDPSGSPIIVGLMGARGAGEKGAKPLISCLLFGCSQRRRRMLLSTYPAAHQNQSPLQQAILDRGFRAANGRESINAAVAVRFGRLPGLSATPAGSKGGRKGRRGPRSAGIPHSMPASLILRPSASARVRLSSTAVTRLLAELDASRRARRKQPRPTTSAWPPQSRVRIQYPRQTSDVPPKSPERPSNGPNAASKWLMRRKILHELCAFAHASWVWGTFS